MQREGKSGAEASKAPASHVSPTSAVCSFPCAKARSWEGLGEARPGRAASRPGLCDIAPGRKIRKLWYIYTMEHYSAIRKNTFESVLMRWMNLEPIIQSEVSQKEKDKYHILTHIYGI